MSSTDVKSFNIDRKSYGALNSDPSYAQRNEQTENVASCTVFETTCNLLTILTGSGMLSLPYAAAASGWSAMGLLVVLCGVFMYSFELLAKTIEEHYAHENTFRLKHISHYNIDYLSLGLITFGQYGDKIVLSVFGTEITLALVSFLMNIGINLHVINPALSVNQGIVLASALTGALSFANLKMVAYSSFIGLAMTLLTVVAILVSGMELRGGVDVVESREYEVVHYAGIPVSLGLIAFCFGGHGTFPKMYSAMAERHRYREVLGYTTVVLLATYLFIMGSGYYYFAQYTLSPVTMNIGRDLQYHTTKYGFPLKVTAALGIVCNLQVTCPLLTFAIRDMALKIFSIQATERAQKYVALTVLLCVTPVAVCLSGNFAALCSVIGSFATVANSIVLPMVFYHTVHTEVSACTMLMHGGIVLLAVTSAVVGMYANFGKYLW